MRRGARITSAQVWLDKKLSEGELEGDWLMSKVLGLETSIAQSVAQTHDTASKP